MSTIPPGDSTKFTVRYKVIAEGSKGARIAIANNDGDENPYDLEFEGLAEQCQLRMIVDPSEGGTTDPVPGNHLYMPDAVVQIQAIPALGYEFTGWSGKQDDSTAANTTIIMNKSKILTANFKPSKSRILHLRLLFMPFLLTVRSLSHRMLQFNL